MVGEEEKMATHYYRPDELGRSHFEGCPKNDDIKEPCRCALIWALVLIEVLEIRGHAQRLEELGAGILLAPSTDYSARWDD